MKTRVNVTYLLLLSKRKVDGSIPIYVRITSNRQSVLISTGKSIPEKEWNKKTKRVRSSSPRSHLINESLLTIENQVHSIVNKLIQQDQPFTVHEIKEILNKKDTPEYVPTIHSCFEDYITQIQKLMNKDYSKQTYFKYRITMDRTMQFIRMTYKKSDFKVEELQDKFLMDFESFLRVNIGNSPKTIHKHIQRFKTVLHYASRRGVIKHLPSLHYKVKVPIKKIEYLTQEEIDRIEMKEIQIERLNIIRDLFIFSCYSGLSYTEMRNLHESHLQTIDSQIWIDMIRQKTKRSLKIPLLPKCVNIIEKYELHTARKSKGLLLPVPTNQKFNSYLKELNDICSITTRITCHLGRRSYATSILLRNKIHIAAISKMLGHHDISTTIKSYMGSVPELIMSEFEKIKEIYHKE